jgi:concanavalin A-like lectin/glucanase superfamily protein/BACON domain-containing protein
MGSLRCLSCALACAIALLALPATALAAPTATIAAPAAGATWAAGQPIPVAGSALAADGHRLSRWALHWSLSVRSCSDDGHCDLKRVTELTGSSGTFTAPDRSRPAQLVVSLAATDSDGTPDTKTVSLEAETSQVALTTSPPGFQVSLDDDTATAPVRGTFVVGSHVTIDAPEPQTLFGYDYAFGAWSDAVPKRFTIAVPESDSSYEASFRFTGRRTLLGTAAVGDETAEAQPGQAQPSRFLASRSGTVDRVRLSVDSDSTASQLVLGVYADAGGTPGALLGSGTTSTVAPGEWNEVVLDPQPKLAVGRTYWVGVQNPATSTGVLVWRVNGDGGRASAYALGPAPPVPDRGVDVEPGRLSFATAAGSDGPPAQSIVVQANSGGCGPCAWQISDDADWLSETPDSGDWPTRVNVSVDASALAPGIYRATVEVARGTDGDATAIPVVLRVAAPSEHLVGAWSFDESSGTTVTDSSGHGNNGTIEGAVRTSGGLAGGAIVFDGDDDLVTIPDSRSLDFSGGLTVEGWVRPNVLAGSLRALAVKEGDGEPFTWGLFAAGVGGLPSGHAITDAERIARASAKVSLVPVWTHLATTYDGSQVRLYLNGRLVASAPQKGPLAVGSGPLHIGGTELGQWFDGLIDEVRVYDRALTAGEVQLDLATPITPAG